MYFVFGTIGTIAFFFIASSTKQQCVTNVPDHTYHILRSVRSITPMGAQKSQVYLLTTQHKRYRRETSETSNDTCSVLRAYLHRVQDRALSFVPMCLQLIVYSRTYILKCGHLIYNRSMFFM